MATSASHHRGRADLRVGQKLGIGFGLVGLVAAALVLVTFMAIDRLDDASAVEQDALERAEAAASIQFHAAVMRSEQLSYVTTRGDTRISFEAASSNFEDALVDLRSAVSSPVQVALEKKISTGFHTFRSIDSFVWEAILDGRVALAEHLVNGPAALDFGFLALDADLFAADARRDELLAKDAFEETQLRASLVTGALGVLALVVVAGASWYITRMIRDPLLEVQRAAVQAADGDLEVEAPVHGSDETGTLAAAFNSMLRELRVRESSLLRERERSELERQINTALELAETEDEVFSLLVRALQRVSPDRSSELLIAENSRSHLEQVLVGGPTPSGPGCRVPSLFSCPAVRSAEVVNYQSSTALDACPHLQDRSSGHCSAICVPVSFMGRAIGVLHSTDAESEIPDDDVAEGLEMLGRATGGRIGVIRTTAQTELQATTDGMTGLFNRRTFEAKVRPLLQDGETVTLVMADLDHFKVLNDTFGHDAGDKALQLFSKVLLETVRDQDVVCRWGGEEFMIALIGSNVEDAAVTLERLRVELHGRIATTQTSPFTVSFGYLEASACADLESAVNLVDGALYRAKDNGRDQAVLASPIGSKDEPSKLSYHPSQDAEV